jgi:putative transposase
LDILLNVDNYSTLKHPKVKCWLAAHLRYQVHYTPTYAFWLNQIDILGDLIAQRTVRRGTLKSVKQLVVNIEQFVKRHNRNFCPFVRAVTTDSILEKIKRLCQCISETW